MSSVMTYTRTLVGITAPLVMVEAHVSYGVPRFSIVGLPELAVKESKDRVRSTLLNTHYEYPKGRVTVNLAPANLAKEGNHFDLAIALGILAATHQLPRNNLEKYEFAGELGLFGELRPVKNILLLALGAKNARRALIVPADNVEEALLVKDVQVYAANHFLEVCAHLCGHTLLSLATSDMSPALPPAPKMDLAHVYGQAQAKRALEIAASGGHSLLLMGPPGTGKTLLANCLPGILPDLTEAEALEVAAIKIVSGKPFDYRSWKVRPYRSPHHTASYVAMVGGGQPPSPGEISLAHHGVLFLDELPEFNRRLLEALREPMEAGEITISRAHQQAIFPTQFQLIAAMNPCPCGHAGNPEQHCRCTSAQIQQYQGKISGPLLDRIDMIVQVPFLPPSVLLRSKESAVDTSDCIKSRVTHIRHWQYQQRGFLNKALQGNALLAVCQLQEKEQQLLEHAISKFKLSARAYHRILKVARTIADMDGQALIQVSHLAEALSYKHFHQS